METVSRDIKQGYVKKVLLVLSVFIIAILVASCVPDEPSEVLPYCHDQYEDLLIDDPNFPPAFIGACVAYWQSEEPTAFVSLCGYEPFWEMIEMDVGDPIDSRKACTDFIRVLED